VDTAPYSAFAKESKEKLGCVSCELAGKYTFSSRFAEFKFLAKDDIVPGNSAILD